MYTVLTYGFPLVLLLFEWGLRAILKVDASAFIGPTLAAAALSFLMPLTRPAEQNYGFIFNRQVVVTSRFDSNFIGFTWLLVLLCLFAWAASCYFSIITPDDRTFLFPTHATIGGTAYIASLVMSSLKERS